RAGLAPFGRRDAAVGALGAGERLELGCEPGSGQYSEQTALRCRDRAEAHVPLSVTAAAGEAAPAPPVRALFALAHVELPALDVAPVQRRDGLLGLVVRTHLDEPEAARAPGLAVRDDRRGLTGSHLGKQRLQIRTR